MGLVHALRSSAEAALGDEDGPLRAHAPVDGIRGAAAARRSVDLLEMLLERTAGNLTETERDTLWTALRTLRGRLPPPEARPGSDDEEPAAPAAAGRRRP